MFIDIRKNKQNSNNTAKLRSMYTLCILELKKWQVGSGEFQKQYKKINIYKQL